MEFYHSTVDDLIVWDGEKADNIEKAEINGLEFALNFEKLGGIHDFNMSYTDAENKQTKEQLVRRAKEKFNYKFTTSIQEADIYMEYQFVGSRLDSNSVNLNSYQLVNLGLTYDISKNVSISSRITNLLDKDCNTISIIILFLSKKTNFFDFLSLTIFNYLYKKQFFISKYCFNG